MRGARARSWYTVAIPTACAARGDPNTLEITVQFHRALGVVVQPRDDLDERRLPGAVVAKHACDLTLAHDDVDPSEGVDVAVALADVVELEDRAVGGVSLELGLCKRAHHASAFFLT